MTAPLSAANMPAGFVMAVREQLGVKPVRPTDRDDLLVLWCGSPEWVPAEVKSGTAGRHKGDLVIPLPSPVASK